MFTAGLTRRPDELAAFVYEFWINEVLTQSSLWAQYSAHSKESLSKDFEMFQELYREGAPRLTGSWNHNKYINYYNHAEDDNLQRSRDVTPIYTPSGLYQFIAMKEELLLADKDTEVENGKCSISVCWPEAKATRSILSACREISWQQPVVYLLLLGLQSSTAVAITPDDVLSLSTSTTSVHIGWCDLPTRLVLVDRV